MIIATDTTSYENMILNTMSNDGETISHYQLLPADGYVLHSHDSCITDGEEYGVPNKCVYFRLARISVHAPLQTVIAQYEAVLESTVPADHIYGGKNTRDA